MTVSSREACRRTGLSYRQLDYWSRAGVLRPALDATGSGSRRGFTDHQVEVLRVLGSLNKIAAFGYVGQGGPRISMDVMASTAKALTDDPSLLASDLLFVSPTGAVGAAPTMGYCIDLASLRRERIEVPS